MERNRVRAVPHDLAHLPSRRAVLRGLVAAGFGWGTGRLTNGAAKKKRKKKRRPNQDHNPSGPLCASTGEACDEPGGGCQERFCLQAPFTIAANWTQGGANHHTVLFVPPAGGATGPSPFINAECNPTNSTCAVAYPFACVDRNATGPGNEVTTVFEKLPGRYEYRMLIDSPAPAGELTVVLTDRVGRVVRAWANPASAPMGFVGWHVFDVDADGRVASVDVLRAINGDPDVCPYPALGRQSRDRAATRGESHRSERAKENR